MIKLFATNRNFRKLLSSSVISQIGTNFSYMLLIVLAFSRTNNMLTTMGVTFASCIGSLLAGSVAGVFVDRKSPIRIMIVANLLNGLTIALLFWLPTNIWYYDSAAFLMSLFSSFSSPAYNKCQVASVSREELMNSNASMQVLRELVKIIGPGLATTVLALLPAHLKGVGFLIDAASYLIACFIFMGLRVPSLQANTAGTNASKKTKRSFKEEWLEGLKPLRNPVTSTLLVLFVLIILMIAGFDVILTANLHLYGMSPLYFGYLMSSLSAGLIVASLFGPRFFSKWPIWFRLGGTVVGFGIFYAGIGLFHNFYLMLASAFFMGIFNAVYNVTAPTYWQEHVPEEQLGRFYSIVTSMMSMVTIAGMAINGVLGTVTTPSFVLVLSGCILALLAFVGSFIIAFWTRRTEQETSAVPLS